MFKDWVLFKIVAHRELYFVGLRMGHPVTTDDRDEAEHFGSSGEAYKFAGKLGLDDWKVGLR